MYWLEEHFIGVIITLGIIISIICVGFKYNNDEKNWNDGHCTCGGQWEFVDTTTRTYHHHYQNNINTNYHSTTYYWKCDKCGSILETSYNFKKAK